MTTQCPICNAERYELVYKDIKQHPELKIVCCNDCRHIYTFSNCDIDENKLYSEGVYKVTEAPQSFFDKIINRGYKKIIRRISRLTPGKESLLDFGCGKGKFAAIAKKNEWKVKGVETATERAAYAKKMFDLDVSSNFYSSGKIFDTSFDVITLFHVLEHLPHPKELLNELINNNLSKNGLVVIEVPNFNSWQRKIAGKRWLHLDATRHINHFTSTELDKIGKELNLTLVRTGSFSFHLGVLGMTDSLLKIVGYRQNIIEQLKNRRSFWLLARIGFILPFAWLLEKLAAICGHGGITRKYFYHN